MAFGAIDTFYFPVTANAGTSLFGTDIRKLLSGADADDDTTSVTNHGTGAAVQRTVDPFSTSATDANQADYGLAIAPADMNSVVGARRVFPAGNHVLTARINSNSAVGSNNNSRLYFYAYLVGPSPGRARTLLGSANSGLFSFPTLSAVLTVNVTLALPKILFEADETIMYAQEMNTPGAAVTGILITHHTGTNGGVAVRVDTPGLRTNYDLSASITGAGNASRGPLLLSILRNLAGTGSATITRTVIAAKSFSITGIGSIQRQQVSQAFRAFSLIGAGQVTATRTVIAAKSIALTGAGSVAHQMSIALARSLTGSGSVTASKAVIASKSFSLTGIGTITEMHPVQAFRTFNLTGIGLVTGRIEIPIDEVPTGGGGTTIIRRKKFSGDD